MLPYEPLDVRNVVGGLGKEYLSLHSAFHWVPHCDGMYAFSYEPEGLGWGSETKVFEVLQDTAGRESWFWACQSP